ERHGDDAHRVYIDLASRASVADRPEEAAGGARRGRQADPAARRAARAPVWDMFEVRLKARTEPPEVWVGEIAAALDRYAEDPDASQVVMMGLIDLGLIRMVAHPERPGEVLLDSRPLQTLLAEYGPRV